MAKDNTYREYKCDLCQSKNAVEVPYVRQYTRGQVIHICKNCGFIYVKMRRSYNKIAQVWSKKLFGKAYTSKTPLMLARHTYIAEFIDKKVGLRNKKVCDIGGGEGQFLSILKQNYGSKVFGIESSEFNCHLMNKSGIRNYQGTLEEYISSSSSNKYQANIVTMMWTLENTTSPVDIILGARKIIKKDGYLVVATGSRIMVPFSKPLNLYLSSNPVDTHSSRFSVNTLKAFLELNGFKVVHINSYMNDSLTLCVIAKKCKVRKKVKIKGDDYKDVCDFFKRWHRETLFYKTKS